MLISEITAGTPETAGAGIVWIFGVLLFGAIALGTSGFDLPAGTSHHPATKNISWIAAAATAVSLAFFIPGVISWNENRLETEAVSNSNFERRVMERYGLAIDASHDSRKDGSETLGTDREGSNILVRVVENEGRLLLISGGRELPTIQPDSGTSAE